MYITKYFTVKELCKSNTADAHAIANTPNEQEEHCLLALIENVLDPLRESFGNPINITSGFRCEELNALVGGSKTSAHMFGQAADMVVYKRKDDGSVVRDKTGKPIVDKEGNQRLFELCISLGLQFRQLIDEYGFSWVHVSYQAGGNKRQVLHIK